MILNSIIQLTTSIVFRIVAKDRLSDLTSREGDWFLDELCSMSGNVNQLLLLLKDYPFVSERQIFTLEFLVALQMSPLQFIPFLAWLGILARPTDVSFMPRRREDFLRAGSLTATNSFTSTMLEHLV